MLEGSTFKETTVKDYLPLIQEKFPDINPSDLRKIVEYGWRMYYSAHIQGCDTLFKSLKNNFWFYTGRLTKDSVKHFNYYRRKLVFKLKYLYRKKKPDLPLEYYTGLTDEEYALLYRNLNKKGKRKKYYEFKNKMCYRLLDACLINSGFKYFMKFNVLSDKGFKFYKEVLKCEYPLIAHVRDKCPTFEDILVNNNDYELL